MSDAPLTKDHRNKRVEYTIHLRAEIRRRNKMSQLIEVEIPCREGINQAEKLRRPFVNLILKAASNKRQTR